jgi:hypothetical protein
MPGKVINECPRSTNSATNAFATPLGSVGLDQLLGRGIVARVGLAFVPLQKGLSRQFSKPYFPGWARLRGHYFERPMTYVDIQRVTAHSLRHSFATAV